MLSTYEECRINSNCLSDCFYKRITSIQGRDYKSCKLGYIYLNFNENHYILTHRCARRERTTHFPKSKILCHYQTLKQTENSVVSVNVNNRSSKTAIRQFWQIPNKHRILKFRFTLNIIIRLCLFIKFRIIYILSLTLLSGVGCLKLLITFLITIL